LLRQIGGEGLTNYPIGVGINSLGEVVIADNHNNFNLTVFSQDGTLISAFESKVCCFLFLLFYFNFLYLQVKHAQCFDVALTTEGSVVLASKDYRLYLYRYMDSPLNNNNTTTSNNMYHQSAAMPISSSPLGGGQQQTFVPSSGSSGGGGGGGFGAIGGATTSTMMSGSRTSSGLFSEFCVCEFQFTILFCFLDAFANSMNSNNGNECNSNNNNNNNNNKGPLLDGSLVGALDHIF
jgi:hypothetical protein